jgi:hypothetical protein
MRTSEGKTSHHSRTNGHSTAKNLDELRRLGRTLPRKVRHEMAERPQLVLAAVAGVSFLAGATLGSRLGRLVLSAAIPIALERLVAGQLGPRLTKYAEDLWSETAKPSHAVS